MHRNRMPLYLLGAAAIAAALVIAGAPLAGILPFGLLLACPLMMVFMMKSMSGNHSNTHAAAPPTSRPR